MSFASMIGKLQGQPSSYEKKSKYKFGKTLGAGTYGIVREAESAQGKVAIKIILKKNVKGNDQMVYDELRMLESMHHPHIVKFHDWFESKDKYYIVTQLATGGELFDRICDKGRFVEQDASTTIKQVLEAVQYLHANDVVHRDLKPENLLYLAKDEDQLVLADFGIAKHLDSADGVLKTMAGSFGYAAPEIMLKQGHGKPVDMWSMGVITYTLLCGYSPFRSDNMQDLIRETTAGRVVFHERYWSYVTQEAKDFIMTMLKPDPHERVTATQALEHPWIAGKVAATDHNLLPEIKAYMAKARLRRGIEMVKLANRIEALKMQDDEEQSGDVPDAEEAVAAAAAGSMSPLESGKAKLNRAAKSAIFREVVLAKVREMRADEEKEKVVSGEVKPS